MSYEQIGTRITSRCLRKIQRSNDKETINLIEYHPSMSLQCLPLYESMLESTFTLNKNDTNQELQHHSIKEESVNKNLKSVFNIRYNLWKKVHKIHEELQEYDKNKKIFQDKITSLNELYQLHSICQLREKYLRTLHIALLKELHANSEDKV